MAIPERSYHTMLGVGDPEAENQQSAPPLAVPPSPTLTNPDLILPCEDGERETSPPSPPFNLPSLSHLQASYGMRLPSESTGGPAQTYGRLQVNSPRHMFFHDPVDAASRRLSDIGEEEVPSEARSGASITVTPGNVLANRVARGQMESDTAKESGAWSSSSSTVSGVSERNGTKGQNGYVASRDGGGMNLHGVDKALDANSGDEGDEPRSNMDNNMAPAVEGGGPGEDFSSAILSSEAERILDNAKKRLTLMEGNLTKARSSVRLSSSPSPLQSAGTQPLGLGQPVGGLYRSISRGDRKASAALRPRSTYGSSQDSSNNQHSRVYSDLNLSATTQPFAPSDPDTTRSMSAMGSSTMPEFHNDERTFQYEPTRAYLTHRASVLSMKPAGEKASPPVVPEADSPEVQELGVSEADNEGKISSVEEFNSVYPLSGPPSRTQSQLQVRDLQDQMKGLHIKISTLKIKAQEDGLRRRSIQSLRTPSPFSSENHWYDNDMAYKGIRSANSKVEAEFAQDTGRSDTPTLEGHAMHGNGHEARELADDPTKKTGASSVVTEIDDDDAQSAIESLYEDAEEGDYNDGGSGNEMVGGPVDDRLAKTLEAFPRVPSSSEATPHEDREDAFDYEHFILHSALGNYAQARARMRRPSGSSTGSDETTRPTHDRSVRHSRSNSANSQSTMMSFATATEGERASDDELESVLYWDRRFNDELRNRDDYSDSDEEAEESRVAQRGRSRQTNGSKSGSKTTDDNPWSLPSTGSATPLASSFVSTVQTSRSHPDSEKSGLNNDDSRMLEQLFQSLGKVCIELQAQTGRDEADEKTVRVLRRRLDAARRVLEGELDA